MRIAKILNQVYDRQLVSVALFFINSYLSIISSPCFRITVHETVSTFYLGFDKEAEKKEDAMNCKTGGEVSHT